MQAILTKYLPPTNFKPSRIKAICERGSLICSYDSAESNEVAHAYAANRLCERFAAEDAERYKSEPATNPWMRKRVMGGLPTGGYAHVFVS